MPVAGLGVDIVEIARMKRALAKSPSMRARAFSVDEQKFCDKSARPEIQYALRFAAKEAVLKALGTGFGGMKFTDVEVVFNDRGKVEPKLYGRAAAFAQQEGVVEMHLSLSFTHSTAVASAIAITPEARPAPKEEKVDPRAELAASFKELRKELDGLDASVEEGDEHVGPNGKEVHDVARSQEKDATQAEDTHP